MSGHSHWSTVKRQKQASDQRKGKLFSKLSRAIALATREGSDPQFNSKLRVAIEKAKEAHMPNDNIQKAIERGSGVGEGGNLEEVSLEGYGPGGVAFLVTAVTDNRNRTIAEVRSLFQRHQGSLGEQGSAAYIFAQDKENPRFVIPVTEERLAQQVLTLTDALDDHEDVQEVWSNFDIPEEIMRKIQ